MCAFPFSMAPVLFLKSCLGSYFVPSRFFPSHLFQRYNCSACSFWNLEVALFERAEAVHYVFVFVFFFFFCISAAHLVSTLVGAWAMWFLIFFCRDFMLFFLRSTFQFFFLSSLQCWIRHYYCFFFPAVVCRSRRTIPSLSVCLCMHIQATNDDKS